MTGSRAKIGVDWILVGCFNDSSPHRCNHAPAGLSSQRRLPTIDVRHPQSDGTGACRGAPSGGGTSEHRQRGGRSSDLRAGPWGRRPFSFRFPVTIFSELRSRRVQT